MSLVLYRKYRPSTFGEVIGQKNTIKILTSAISGDRISHAYLFTGPRGTGKTTIARILAKTINCLDVKNGEPCNKCTNCVTINEGKTFDIVEIDAASNTGVDNIRELKATIGFSPSHLKYKVFIIDEVHMLSKGAFNALLKTLEEPPAHAIFIMATTEIHKIPATIISRSQRFDFQKLKLDEMIKRLSEIANKEKIKVAKEVLETIALASDGGMRDAESLLGQIISIADGEKEIGLAEIKSILGLTDADSVIKYIEYLSGTKTKEAIIFLGELNFSGQDLEQFTGSVIDIFRKMLLVKVSSELKKHLEENSTEEQIKKISDLAGIFSEQELLWFIKKFIGVKNEIKSSTIAQLPLELVTIEYDILKNKGKSATISDIQAMPFGGSVIKEKKSASGGSALGGEKSVYKTLVKVKSSDEKKTDLQAVEKKTAPTAEVVNIEAEKSAFSGSALGGKEEDSREVEVKGINLELEEIKSGWNGVIRISKKYNHSISAFLKLSVPVELKGDLLIIATPYKFHAEKLGEAANREIITKVIAEVFTKATGIKVKVIQDEKVVTKPVANKDMVADKKSGSALGGQADVPDSANFSAAMDVFGGEIS